MDEKLIEELRVIARMKTVEDAADADDEDFNVDDYAGGNIDDAYEHGYNTGRVDTARLVLEKMGLTWYERVP